MKNNPYNDGMVMTHAAKLLETAANHHLYFPFPNYSIAIDHQDTRLTLSL